MEKFLQDTSSQEEKASPDLIHNISKNFFDKAFLIEVFRFLRSEKGMTEGDSLQFLEEYFKVRFNQAQACEIIKNAGFEVTLF